MNGSGSKCVDFKIQTTKLNKETSLKQLYLMVYHCVKDPLPLFSFQMQQQQVQST